METIITIERDPDSDSASAYSMDPTIIVVRDAAVSDRDLLAAFADALEESRALTA